MYSQDGSMQYEFTDFPFVPTDDQLKATEEIKRDMKRASDGSFIMW